MAASEKNDTFFRSNVYFLMTLYECKMHLRKLYGQQMQSKGKSVRVSRTHVTCSQPGVTGSSILCNVDRQPVFLKYLKTPFLCTSILLTLCKPVLAENVKVEDVESSVLKAGLEAANNGNLDAAERFFSIYISQEESQGMASGLSNLGNVHLQMKKTTQALEDFTKALSLAPDAPVIHMNRAIAYEQLGLDLEKEGKVNQAQEMYLKGLEDCYSAVKEDPNEFAAWYDRGNIEMRLGMFNDARDSYSKAADLAPGLAGYRVRAAALLFQTGDVQKSMQQLRGVVRKNGNYGEAHAALASVLWSTGDRAKAEEELTRALQADDFWGTPSQVRENTRWPPALYKAYSDLIHIK